MNNNTNTFIPSGTPYTVKFIISGVEPFPITSLDFHKDINSSINGGKLTIPLLSDIYKKLKINQNFSLYFGWNTNKEKPIQIMTGYLTNIKVGNNIEIDFEDKGAKLRKTYKAMYNQWHRLKIIEDGINRSGLTPKMDYSKGTGDQIDFDCGSEDLNGKSYESMLKELIEGSTQDLAVVIQDEACKIVNMGNIPYTERLPIHEGVNIVKDSVSISEVSSSLVNHMTLYFKDNTRQHHVTRVNTESINRFGEIPDVIEKSEIQTIVHAIEYADKLLKKNNRENGLEIDLSVIASPYYDLLTPCHVKIPKYNINKNMRISCINFTLTATKTPTMNLRLNQYGE